MHENIKATSKLKRISKDTSRTDSDIVGNVDNVSFWCPFQGCIRPLSVQIILSLVDVAGKELLT